MDTSTHSLQTLFAQLGLPADAAGVARFVDAHRGLGAGTALPDADFWTPAQAAFLRESLDQDADWAELVDQLDALLRH